MFVGSILPRVPTSIFIIDTFLCYNCSCTKYFLGLPVFGVYKICTYVYVPVSIMCSRTDLNKENVNKILVLVLPIQTSFAKSRNTETVLIVPTLSWLCRPFGFVIHLSCSKRYRNENRRKPLCRC